MPTSISVISRYCTVIARLRLCKYAFTTVPMRPLWRVWVNILHYNDVIMSAMASQSTSLAIVYSTVYSGADQRKHQSSASLAYVRGIHRWPVNSPRKRPVTQKMFPLDDVIMTWFHSKPCYNVTTTKQIIIKPSANLLGCTTLPFKDTRKVTSPNIGNHTKVCMQTIHHKVSFCELGVIGISVCISSI